MVSTTATERRSLPGILLLFAALIVALLTFIPTAAHAEATDDESAMQTEVCAPSATVGCLTGTLRDAGKGVVVSATGPGGTVSTETDDDGRWSLSVEQPGEYSVTVDADTLPEGVTLRSDEPQVRTVTLGANTAALFSLESSGGDTGNGGGSSGGASSADTGFNWDRLAQQAASGLRLGLLLALAAVGLSLIYGTTGISNFAHGELVTLGGLLAFVFANLLGLNIWLAGIIVIVLCAAFGYTQDLAIWKPLRKKRLSLTQLMIVTIGMSLALQYVFQFFIGASTVRIVMANPKPVQIGPVSLSQDSLIAMGIAVVVLVAVGLFLVKTRVGRATRAVSDNPALAAASGINVDGVIRLIWTASAALAGLAGILLGLVLNGINWMTGMQLLLLLFSAVTLGGLGTAFGALFGALIIGMTVELTNIWLPGDFKYATALLLLILLLLVRPQGLFGRKERVG
ncbi:neutral amino acid transport system permease protein [Microbacterium sp. SORGH_AS428]|uniref:branched-chain amino acid ABC transporter permease n=1 Tax=Microbacterium sp. SORGH_AS_0428 TaxID=3041788 RepID=UPI00285599C8|nr:branched-chain amino acid ABC transporter permease [Microbacterium sp. SORGH_AS_0428]MDR6199225.1 neutral amino acid transport system permease protein [Microbacterium sp. SORGH_AS_0428]